MFRCASAVVRVSISVHSHPIRVLTETQSAFGCQKAYGALEGAVIEGLWFRRKREPGMVLKAPP